MRIWDAVSGNPVKGPLVSRQPLPDSRALASLHARSIAFSKSGRFLSTLSLEGVNQVWEVSTAKSLGKPELSNVAIVDFADSERLVVLIGIDLAIHAYDVQTGEPKYIVKGNGETYTDATVSPNGERIAGCGSSGNVVMLEAATGKEAKPLTTSVFRTTLTASAFSSDGRLLAVGSIDGFVRLWDISEGRLLWAPRQLLSTSIDRLEFSSDGASLAVINRESRLRLVASQSGDSIAPPIATLSPMKLASWTDVPGRIATVGVDGIGRRGIWNIASQRRNSRVRMKSIWQRSPRIDGMLAVAEATGAVYLFKLLPTSDWMPDSEKRVQVGDRRVDAIALANDGSRLAISTDRDFSVRETANQNRVVCPLHGRRGCRANSFYAEWNFACLCFHCKGHAAVWDVATGRRLYQPLYVGEPLKDIDIDREGKRCAVAIGLGESRSGNWPADNESARALLRADLPISFVSSTSDEWHSLHSIENRRSYLDIGTGHRSALARSRSDAHCIALSDDEKLFSDRIPRRNGSTLEFGRFFSRLAHL